MSATLLWKLCNRCFLEIFQNFWDLLLFKTLCDCSSFRQKLCRWKTIDKKLSRDMELKNFWFRDHVISRNKFDNICRIIFWKMWTCIQCTLLFVPFYSHIFKEKRHWTTITRSRHRRSPLKVHFQVGENFRQLKVL